MALTLFLLGIALVTGAFLLIQLCYALYVFKKNPLMVTAVMAVLWGLLCAELLGMYNLQVWPAHYEEATYEYELSVRADKTQTLKAVEPVILDRGVFYGQCGVTQEAEQYLAKKGYNVAQSMAYLQRTDALRSSYRYCRAEFMRRLHKKQYQEDLVFAKLLDLFGTYEQQLYFR